MDDALRYPVGRFAHSGPVTPADLDAWIGEIERLPASLRTALAGLDEDAIDTPYRPGGWTVRQVVHHLADSHTNAFLRTRWALTEAEPAVLAYDEDAWVHLPDGALPPAVSLDLLAALHTRWVAMLRGLAPDQWERTFLHPANGLSRLDRTTGMYAWHGRHHLAHIGLVAGR